MELDCTWLLDEDCGQFSGSIAELGQDAGRYTWNNSMTEAESAWPDMTPTAPEGQGLLWRLRSLGGGRNRSVDATGGQGVAYPVHCRRYPGSRVLLLG